MTKKHKALLLILTLTLVKSTFGMETEKVGMRVTKEVQRRILKHPYPDIAATLLAQYCIEHEPDLIREARKGNLNNVQALLEKGADPNSTFDEFGRSALIAAAEKEHKPIVELLLEEGARYLLEEQENLTTEQLAQLNAQDSPEKSKKRTLYLLIAKKLKEAVAAKSK